MRASYAARGSERRPAVGRGGGVRRPAPSAAGSGDPRRALGHLVTAHATHAPRTGRSHSFAGQLAGLLHPSGELSFVELVVLMDVEVARVLALGLAGGDRTQRRAAEESPLDVLREAMEAEEPTLALDSIEGRVPFDRLADAGDGAHDERVEAAPHVAFPTRHGSDVGLDGGVAVALRNLRVAACEKGRLCNLADFRLRRRLARFGRLRIDPLGGGLL